MCGMTVQHQLGVVWEQIFGTASVTSKQQGAQTEPRQQDIDTGRHTGSKQLDMQAGEAGSRETDRRQQRERQRRAPWFAASVSAS